MTWQGGIGSVRALGIDVVDVERIRAAMERPGFVSRILTPAEQAHCRTPQQVAGRWAAKEAIMKCLPGSPNFLDIEILPSASGAPVVARPSGPWLVTISHEKGLAVAAAVLGTGDGP